MRSIEDVAEAGDRQTSLVEVLPGLGESQHRSADAAREQIEGDELAHRDAAVNDLLRAYVQDRRRDQLADELNSLAGGVAQS